MTSAPPSGQYFLVVFYWLKFEPTLKCDLTPPNERTWQAEQTLC